MGLPALSPLPAFAQLIARDVEVIDLADGLGEAAEQLLTERTSEIELPVEVSDVTYIFFPDNADNLNGVIREYGEQQRCFLSSFDEVRRDSRPGGPGVAGH